MKEAACEDTSRGSKKPKKPGFDDNLQCGVFPPSLCAREFIAVAFQIPGRPCAGEPGKSKKDANLVRCNGCAFIYQPYHNSEVLYYKIYDQHIVIFLFKIKIDF